MIKSNILLQLILNSHITKIFPPTSIVLGSIDSDFHNLLWLLVNSLSYAKVSDTQLNSAIMVLKRSKEVQNLVLASCLILKEGRYSLELPTMI